MTASPATGRASEDTLAAVLAGFACAQSEHDLLEVLQQAAATHFGAAHAIMLTAEAVPDAGHRIARLTGSAAPGAVEITDPRVLSVLARGTVLRTVTPADHLPGVPVPEDAAHAVLVPCSGAGSTVAACLFWTGDAQAHAPIGSERLRLLAGMAGLALERHLAELRCRILRADCDNRVRNVLALIRSVGTRSAERAFSIEDFLLHFEGRVDAIGRSQITASRGGEISLEHLLREELLAQMIQDGEQVSLEGIDVPVTAEQAEALGLAIHELAVNAVKFGALSGSNGGLRVRWWVESQGEALSLGIDWSESPGAAGGLTRPDRSGFGLTYIEHALPFQLNARVSLEFGRDGLRCRIAVPLGDGRAGRAGRRAGATGSGWAASARRRLRARGGEMPT